MVVDNLLGVILAAGKGERIIPFNQSFAKATLPICNRPLLRYQLSTMRSLGVEEVIIVVGHLGYQIAEAIGDGHADGVTVHYVEQAETLGLAHAVGLLEPMVDRPFLLFLGDIFFVTDDLQPLLEMASQPGVHAVLAAKSENDPQAIRRNYSILLHSDGSVRRVVEKPRYLENNIKGCGLYLFDLPIFDAIRRTPRTAARNEYEITDSIQILIDDGYRVEIASVVRDDVNVTVARDLLVCNVRELERRGLENLIADDVQIKPGATFERSVIGRQCVINHPIRVRESVIFPGTIVSQASDIHGQIVTPSESVSCDLTGI